MNNTLEVLEKQKVSATRTMNAIQADASGQLPTRIQLIKAGKWIASVKGDLDITMEDLHEFKRNFDAGVGLPGNGEVGLPVDFSHEDWSIAALWIKAVEVVDDVLWASEIEYTSKGREALLGGEYKCISPSFYPACLGQWYDPEDPTITARNVLVGAGLTNIPFFKGLTPIMASQSSEGGGRKNVIYVSASTEGDTMDLAQLRTMKKEDLNEEQIAFLNEHKADLQADELVALGLETPAEPAAQATPVEKTDEEKEAESIQASIKKGEKVLVEAAAYKNLEAQVKASAEKLAEYEKEKVEASVKAHVARGAIKQDQAEDWTKKIIADRSLETMLAALPDNPVLASELGSSEGQAQTAREKITALVDAKIAADNSLDRARAISLVRNENKELAAEYDAEIKG